MKKSTITLSIIFPVFNEELTIRKLCQALNKIKNKLPTKTELIFVDDGSRDRTIQAIQKAPFHYPYHILQFSRNFGHQAALLAGLEASQGQAIVTMDADLQHPPELIPRLLTEYKKGHDIVFTHRIDTSEIAWSKKWSSQFFYQLLNLFSITAIQPASSDFRLMSRSAVNALLALPEKRKFLRGMVAWIGFQTTTVPFIVQKRVAGKSKYSMRKMFLLALHGISSFSTLPLYFSAVTGLMLSLMSAFYGSYVLYIRFIVGQAVAGWSSVIFVTLVIGSVISFLLAILGVYVAAIYDEVKGRPVFITKSIIRKTDKREKSNKNA